MLEIVLGVCDLGGVRKIILRKWVWGKIRGMNKSYLGKGEEKESFLDRIVCLKFWDGRKYRVVKDLRKIRGGGIYKEI